MASFQPTRWSLIRRASRDGDSGQRALAELCGAYWRPVFAFYRALGLSADDAQDCTQGLFAALLERGDFAAAEPGRGRFRAWLRTCARNFLHNERDRQRAQKRGGGVAIVSFDAHDEESRCPLEPQDLDDPARCFDRRWAQLLLEQTLTSLEHDERAAGRGRTFEAVRCVLEGEPPGRPWAEVAARLEVSEGALKASAHRLKERFRERLLAAVRDTLDDESEGEELQELMTALQGIAKIRGHGA